LRVRFLRPVECGCRPSQRQMFIEVEAVWRNCRSEVPQRPSPLSRPNRCAASSARVRSCSRRFNASSPASLFDTCCCCNVRRLRLHGSQRVLRVVPETILRRRFVRFVVTSSTVRDAAVGERLADGCFNADVAAGFSPGDAARRIRGGLSGSRLCPSLLDFENNCLRSSPVIRCASTRAGVPSISRAAGVGFFIRSDQSACRVASLDVALNEVTRVADGVTT